MPALALAIGRAGIAANNDGTRDFCCAGTEPFSGCPSKDRGLRGLLLT
jgi:hypothetical protein